METLGEEVMARPCSRASLPAEHVSCPLVLLRGGLGQAGVRGLG